MSARLRFLIVMPRGLQRNPQRTITHVQRNDLPKTQPTALRDPPRPKGGSPTQVTAPSRPTMMRKTQQTLGMILDRPHARGSPQFETHDVC